MFIGAGSEADGVGEEIPDDVPSDVPEDAPEGIFGNNDVGDVVDSAGLDGLKVFTVRGIVAFLVVFGWVGVLMDNGGAKLRLAHYEKRITMTRFCFAYFLLFVKKKCVICRRRSDGRCCLRYRW
jgi:hypothetical protein